MKDFPSEKPRRRFLAQLGAGAALLAGGPRLARGQVPARTDNSPHDAWLNDLHGAHRQFFHVVNPGPTSLLPVRNFLEIYGEDYGVAPADVNAVVGLMGPAVAVGMNDELWAKYPLGTVASFNDPTTRQPATANPLASGTDFSVTALQGRGVRFLICNMTLRFLAGTIGRQLESTAESVYADFRAGLLPGMIVVPGMVVAINRAQERGLTYVRIA